MLESEDKGERLGRVDNLHFQLALYFLPSTRGRTILLMSGENNGQERPGDVLMMITAVARTKESELVQEGKKGRGKKRTQRRVEVAFVVLVK
jgi:hypothetical protein